MIKTLIKIDGNYYAYEDEDGQINIETKQKDAKIIEGYINLKSEVERIIKKCNENDYIFNRIEVLNVGDNY